MDWDCDCDTSVTEFWDKEKRRTRKERECGECKSVIPIGTKYFHIVGKDSDWGFWTFTMCLECNDLWDEVSAIYDEALQHFCQRLGELREYCHEALELDTRCYPFVQRLMKKGLLDEKDVCPGTTLWDEELERRYNDPRQMALALESVS